MAIARKVDGGDRKRNMKEEKRILQIRIDSLMKKIEESKVKWTARTKKVNSTLGLSAEGSAKLRKAREKELRLVWDREKTKMNR